MRLHFRREIDKRRGAAKRANANGEINHIVSLRRIVGLFRAAPQ
jgi:hypothetical protein